MAREPDRSRVPPVLARVLREPLAHFLLIGLALFGINAYLTRGRPGVEPSTQIVVSIDQLRTMEAVFESRWHRRPTPQEFQSMVEDAVREEVLYREGLAMGLDKDDAIVRRRMGQKMQFLAEDVAAAHEPTTAELQEWFAQHSERFALPSRYSFRHLYFSPDKRGKDARSDAAAVLAKIKGQPEGSRLAAASGDSFMFQDYYGDRTPGAIAKEFGPTFALALEKLPTGSWQGPVESGYGWHLVFIDTLIPGRVPAFEEIEEEVKTAWLAEQKEKSWDKAYREMRARYTVLLPGGPVDGAARPRAAPSAREQTPPDISGVAPL